MPAEPIIADVQELKDWAPLIDQQKEQLLTDMVLEASDYIENDLGFVVRAPAAAVTRFYDGDGSKIGGENGEKLYLGDRVKDLAALTVKENGKVLTVATGYTTSADVVAQNRDDAGLLIRRTTPTHVTGAVLVTPRRALTGGWWPGIQNIEVNFLPGWADPIPRDLKRACALIVWHWYEKRHNVGVSSRASRAGTISFRDEIPGEAKAILDRRRRFRP